MNVSSVNSLLFLSEFLYFLFSNLGRAYFRRDPDESTDFCCSTPCFFSPHCSLVVVFLPFCLLRYRSFILIFQTSLLLLLWLVRFGTVALTDSERAGLWDACTERPELLRLILKDLVRVTGVRYMLYMLTVESYISSITHNISERYSNDANSGTRELITCGW